MKKNLNTSDFIEQVFKNRHEVKKDLQNYSKSLFFSHSEGKVYSYREEIAEINTDGEVVLQDKTAPGGNFFSMTTSHHVYKIKYFLAKNKITHEIEDFN